MENGSTGIRRFERMRTLVMLAGLLFFLVNFKIITVVGSSMEPTFHTMDTVIMWRTARFFRPHQVGDIIVFHDTVDTLCIKRICFIQAPDGSAQMPEYLWTPAGYLPVPALLIDNGDVTFPGYLSDIREASRGHRISRTIYVLGDNNRDSMDSRDYGGIEPSQVIGTVVASVTWPFGSSETARSASRQTK
jgi:signal peptidase I